MITVSQAKQLMMRSVPDPIMIEVALEKAHGHFAGSNITAPYDHPLFNCSAVDGYAIRFDDVKGPMKVIEELQAGGKLDRSIDIAQCARIFTGAMVPDGADTVVMQEYCTRTDNIVSVIDPRLVRGGNIRKQGEQLRVGDVAVEQGALLNASAIGLLASVGVNRVLVGRVPQVSIIRTGGEFVDPDSDPLPGKIFSSNDMMLIAALNKVGINATGKNHNAKDDADDLRGAFERALADSDLTICTGGVSVGDHDLVLPVLQQIGAEVIFHRVAQKPGKPMLFATINGKFVFGLPGNPRAVMVLFHEYVEPFLRAMQGAREPGPKRDVLKINSPLEIKGDRAEFRAAVVSNGEVEMLRDEGSHMLRSLMDADVLAYIPDHVRSLKKGDPVEVHWLPK